MAVLQGVDKLRPTARWTWEGWDAVVENLDRTPKTIIEACLDKGVGVVLIPELSTEGFEYDKRSYIRHHYDAIFERLAAGRRREGVYYLDLLPFYKPEDGETLFVDTGHMNDQGYRYFAELVARFLLDERIVKP